MSNYSFSSFKDFFNFYLKKNSIGINGKKEITHSDLAKKINLKSPSMLSMIASGKRLPSDEVLEALFSEWKIVARERKVVRIQLEIERRLAKDRETLKLIEKLTSIDKVGHFKHIDLDTFNSIKEWHLTVLLQLVSTPDFQEDYTLISRKLKKKISPSQAKKGIDTLIKAGLVRRNTKTCKLELTSKTGLELNHNIPSEAVREHHRGMINRALESISEDKIDQRFLISMTLKFDFSKNEQARADINEFIKNFNKKYFVKDANYIAQLNVQFFGHTERNL